MAAAATTAGCGGGERVGETGSGSGSDPTIEALNRRDEPIDASLSLWRLGDADASCDERPETDAETGEETVGPGERAGLLPVTEPGTYGMVFEVGDRREESCLEYSGSETALVWVVESGAVNFTTRAP